MLSLHRNVLIVMTGFLLLLLSTPSLVRAEKTYFDISFDRSVSIDTPEGKKRISDLGDTVTLNKKGRLWLSGNETKEGFVEIVCQNMSSEPVNISLTSLEMPWLSIAEPGKCNAWNKN